MTVNVLLIHGAWQGGWVWDGIVPRLAAAGLARVAVDLPGSAATVANRAAVTFADHVPGLFVLATLSVVLFQTVGLLQRLFFAWSLPRDR